MTATTTTLLQLRRLVARRLGVYYGAPDGSNAAGSLTAGGTTTAADSGRIEGVDYFKGAYFVTTAPTTVQYARISAYTAASGLFAFAKALSTLSVADRYELYRLFSPADFVNAINEAIRRIATVGLTEVASDVSLTLTSNLNYYTIPATFATLYRVSIEDYSVANLFRELSPTDWDIRMGDGVLVLDPSIPGYYPFAAAVASTMRMKLEGRGLLTPNLALETDTTTAPPDFVVPAAAAWLLRTVAQGKRDFQGREELVASLLQESQAAFSLMRPSVRHKNERRVRAP